jgi:hypothetical protein
VPSSNQSSRFMIETTYFWYRLPVDHLIQPLHKLTTNIPMMMTHQHILYDIIYIYAMMFFLFSRMGMSIVVSSCTVAWIVQLLLQPRLPMYEIQVLLFPPPPPPQPRLLPAVFFQWMKSEVTNEMQTVFLTRIQFYNANFLHLTVHAFTFDMYLEDMMAPTTRTANGTRNPNDPMSNDTPSSSSSSSVPDNNNNNNIIQDAWKTTPTTTMATDSTQGNRLLHMMTITDEQQHQRRPPHISNDTTTLWSIDARSNFTVDRFPLCMSWNATSAWQWRTWVQVIYRWTKHTFFTTTTSSSSSSSSKNSNNNNPKNHNKKGEDRYIPFTLPITGVAHIRAGIMKNHPHRPVAQPGAVTNHTLPPPSSSSLYSRMSTVPLTVSIVCDNMLDLWQMRVIGVDCRMHRMVLGWQPLLSTVQDLRAYAVSDLRFHPITGSVLPSSSTSIATQLSQLPNKLGQNLLASRLT